MPVQRWSDRVRVVHLADDPQFSEDMDSLERDLSEAAPFDTVIDLGGMQFLSSSNLSRLLRLRRRTILGDARLVLCNVGTQSWGSFLVTGLDKVFAFATDVSTALASLHIPGPGQAGT